MNVGILAASLHGGGAEAVARRWAEGLATGGHRVVVMTHVAPAETPPAGCTSLHYEGKRGLINWVRAARWIDRTIQEQQLDAVVSVLTFSNLLLLSTRNPPRVQRFISEHTIPSVLLGDEGAAGRAKRWLARRWYRRADGVIAVSHAVATDLLASYGIASARMWVLPNPVTMAPRSDAEMPRQITVAFAGRLVVQKRPERLIETLAVLDSWGIKVNGIVVGDGPLRRELEDLAWNAAVECTFTGWQADWRSAAKDADCLLLPSDVEGFGNVLVEAAESGLPVVAPSQALGVGDAVVPGITGIPALSSRPEDLARAVIAAARLRNEPLRMASWLGWFSVQNSCERLERLLLTTLEHGPSKRDS